MKNYRKRKQGDNELKVGRVLVSAGEVGREGHKVGNSLLSKS